MSAKIIVISSDAFLKKFAIDELSKSYIILPHINSIFEIPANVNKIDGYVVVLDLEFVFPLPSEALVKNLVDNYNLNIIVVGIKNASIFLKNGARSSISRPSMDSAFQKRIFIRNIIDRIELFANSELNRSSIDLRDGFSPSNKIIAIASSTGGTEALSKILPKLPSIMPPILIVQHMPPIFTNQFATRLNSISKISVREARINDSIRSNSALITPGDYHMRLLLKEGLVFVECFKGEKMHAVRPAADVLFDSMANFMGTNVIGVVLTGMGSDGAQGLFKLKKRGAKIIAQDEATSVVFGMPKAAINLKCVDFVLPLDKISEKIVELSK